MAQTGLFLAVTVAVVAAGVVGTGLGLLAADYIASALVDVRRGA